MKKKVVCSGIYYKEGSFRTSPSCSKKNPGYYKRLKRDAIGQGTKVIDKGNGHISILEGSDLMLCAVMEDNKLEMSISHYFKKNIGRLTIKRRKAIKNSMPEKIEIEEQRDIKGKIYYKILESEYDSWLERCQEKLKIKK